MSLLLCNICFVRSGGRYYSSEGSIIISIERGFQITIICFDPTTTTEVMIVDVLLEGGLPKFWVRLRCRRC